jgi:pyruvate/2-oxoglutarate dehydrogenase complex dihydrolipoamide dehydrogenase (E3) component/uncharacterized membrane protein YdjX (TVP38/TMEM64 family)
MGLVVLAVLGLYAVLDLGAYLNLPALQASLAAMRALYAQSPLWVLLGFGVVYALATAMPLPVAAALTLAAGAWFGLLWGVLVVSMASTLGATLAMLSARYLLRDWVQARWGHRLEPLQRGIARNGAWYLLSLRLMPLLPFFLLNVGMGLTRIRLFTYVWVSQVGMLLGTLVYVNAGTQLAQITSAQAVFSPAVLGALALLALLPWLGKAGLAWWQKRRLYARWAGVRPQRFDRNLIVIGAGAAGLVSAYIAAAVKAKVTLVEAHRMGGDCLNYGCVPSKALLQSAKLAHQMRHAARYGLQSAAPSFSFKAVMQRVHDVVRAIAPHDSIERYTRLGVEVLQGHAKLCNPWTVEITHPDGTRQRLSARSIVIAAGAQPIVPPIPGLADVDYLTSDTLWDALAQRDDIAQRIVVLGGGPMGCELAQCLARLGAQVTQIEQNARLLHHEDPQAAALVQQSLQADGVRICTNHLALRCERQGTQQHLIVKRLAPEPSPDPSANPASNPASNPAPPAQEERIPFDLLICAVGRAARLQGYGLEDLGIPTQRTVDTNDYLQTLYPNISAAGDVAGPYQYTHTAAHQAWYATVNALFGDIKRFKADYRAIPRAIFTDPEIACVGLSEPQAQAQGVAYETTQFALADLDRAVCDEGPYHPVPGWVKILTAPGKDRILGATIVGTHASELLAPYCLAMRCGLGLNTILSTVQAYPTWSQAHPQTAGVWKRAHAPAQLLRWVKRFHDWRRG